MNDPTPGEPSPEDGEPASFAENAKNLIKRRKGKILAVGSALGSVALAVVVASLAEGRVAEEAEDQEPLSAPETTDEPRRSPSGYEVDPHLRKLPEGQNASEEKKAKYKEETGDDLPPGRTWVDGWSFLGDSPEDEAPGEAAA
ncbi:hypothetical protein [Streptomyces afghaniensis]|uniref:hypothetical protein n=1 Tax=Streptomyces afghaniensis TaxID=66865 RepID=UPI00278481C7|nr:hypothetical protein [Streptomyces afghaniensis]MDQ1019901.1 hypothetical protein [Streptomyces afghaniensis]